ncbi:unnamed protein product [Scytosiphon promiscuus]
MKILFFSLLFLMIGFSCQNAKKDPVKKPVSVPIKVEKVKFETLQNQINLSGTIKAFKRYELSLMVPGRVERIPVEVGDEIKKGQLLLSLEKTDYQQGVKIAEAKKAHAHDQYTRLLAMYNDSSLAESKLVEITTLKTEADANFELYSNKLNHTNLYAPSPGVINSVFAAKGEVIKEGVPVIEMVNTNQVFARVQVPESEIGVIEKGLACTIKISSLKNKSFQGVIHSIKPVADPLSKTFETRILIQNPDYVLRDGMITEVNIPLKGQEKVLLIPVSSLVRDENEQIYVFLSKNGKATRKRITTGKLLKNRIEVLDGLSEGEELVVGGQNNLIEGENVKIVK